MYSNCSYIKTTSIVGLINISVIMQEKHIKNIQYTVLSVHTKLNKVNHPIVLLRSMVLNLSLAMMPKNKEHSFDH